ncbi:MAG: redoxin domain-containing protein [Pseudomonadaceae bacterium]|nr:redoxin domain-containing protein [Pseudomonadaceae bacterium]
MSDLTVAISFVLLWLVVVVMALVIWVLARQIGVLHERIAPAGALSLRNGLSIGDAAPQVTVEMVSGSQRTIGAANPSGRSTLLFFFSPTCPVCKELLPIIKHSSQSEQDWIDVVLAGDGDPAEHQKILQSAQMQAFPLTLSAALGIAYHVGKLPYAALIDEQGLLQSAGLVNSREHIESLYEAKEMGVKDLQTYLSHNAAERR